MWLFLMAAVVYDWRAISAGTRWLYIGLLGLGLYMLWRGARARMDCVRRTKAGDPAIWMMWDSTDLMFDGFVIVSAMDVAHQAG